MEVHELDARVGGTLRYDMIADAPEMVAEMKRRGQPVSHSTRGCFTQMEPLRSLVLTHLVDFLPGVTPFENSMRVEFHPLGERVRMVVKLSPMHTPEFSRMQELGFSSQISKLDSRFAA